MKLRLDIGRLVANESVSMPLFFNKGVTTLCFILARTVDDSIDWCPAPVHTDALAGQCSQCVCREYECKETPCRNPGSHTKAKRREFRHRNLAQINDMAGGLNTW